MDRSGNKSEWDFKILPVINLLGQSRDTVRMDDALVTLESDKATMDVPPPTAGIIRKWVQLGDRVSRLGDRPGAGRRHGRLQPREKRPGGPRRAPTPTASTPAPETGSFAGQADVSCDMVVLGAGPGGYSAAFRAADLEDSPPYWWNALPWSVTRLNVGCIPSRPAHVAQVLEEAQHLSAAGVELGHPRWIWISSGNTKTGC